MQISKLNMRTNLNQSIRTQSGKATIATTELNLEEMTFWCYH